MCRSAFLVLFLPALAGLVRLLTKQLAQRALRQAAVMVMEPGMDSTARCFWIFSGSWLAACYLPSNVGML